MGRNKNNEVSAALFKKIAPPLPVVTPSAQGGRPRVPDPSAFRACLRSRRGSRWSAIGMSGCFGGAAWARAHASSRGVQSPDFAPTLRAVVFAGARPGVICGVAALANSQAIGCTPCLASQPAKTAARPLRDRKQALTSHPFPRCSLLCLCKTTCLAHRPPHLRRRLPLAPPTPPPPSAARG